MTNAPLYAISTAIALCAFATIAAAQQEGTSSTSVQEQSLLREACQSMKAPARRSDCVSAVDRMSQAKAATSTINAPAQAREEIALRSIPFESGDARDALVKMCVNPRLPILPGDVLARLCKFDNNGRMSMPGFEYGSLASVASVVVNADGGLTRFSAQGSKGEMLQLALLLREKYGQPKVEESQVENKLGQKFAQQVFQWTDSRGTVLRSYP